MNPQANMSLLTQVPPIPSSSHHIPAMTMPKNHPLYCSLFNPTMPSQMERIPTTNGYTHHTGLNHAVDNKFLTPTTIIPPISPRKAPLIPSPELTTSEDSHGIVVELLNKELWKKFHRITNEMVVTKPGRKMFPKIELRISGLDAKANYVIVIGMKSVDNYRYKFQGGGWSPSGQDDLPDSFNKVTHHDGPIATGEFWMKNTIAFDRVKLTNKPNAEGGSQISLFSMHKYQPCITIHKMFSEPANLMPVYTFEPKETEFIAVTAYQSENIIKLKVQHNPFAKGFREGSVRKRSLSQSPESECSPTSSSAVGGCSTVKKFMPSFVPCCDSTTPYRDSATGFNLPFPPYYNLYPNMTSNGSMPTMHHSPGMMVGAMAGSNRPPTSTPTPTNPSANALAVAAVAAGFGVPNFAMSTQSQVPVGQQPYWNSPIYQQFLYQQMLNP